MAAVEETIRRFNPPDFGWDPWAIENLINPYPMHKAMREAGRVVWLPQYEVYATACHSECTEVLADSNRFIVGAGATFFDIRKPGKFRIRSELHEVDPPVHTERRAVLTKIISPVAIRKMRESFEKTAGALVEKVISKGEFDAIPEIAEEYVTQAFPAAVGVRLERAAALAIAEMRFNQSCPHNELYFAAMKSAEPYLEWYEQACQRSAVVPGSIADAIFEAEENGELDKGVASNIVRTFVGGGVDSTISAIGHTLRQLAQNPAALAAVKVDPKKLRATFEESIRLDTPFQFSWRTTSRDTELSGYRLAKDMKVTVLFGGANRDPRRWDNPDLFSLEREVAGNYLGFGTGAHQCIGQMIARFEADALLNAFVSRIETIELTAEPIIRPVNQMRMLGSLPMKVTLS